MNECEVPILEQLLSISEDARQFVEISECHHRNIPYGVLCHKAANEIKKKSLGQIAFDSYYQGKANWIEETRIRRVWDRVANAVAREVRKRDKEKDLNDWDKVSIEGWK